MGKLFTAGVYVFAIIGVLMSAGVGFVYATNTELMNEFWSVKDDFKDVPTERQKEVVAELPARITFEREVAEDMAELPEERRVDLYEQLESSRTQVFEQFKERISREAEISRKAKEAKKDVKDVVKEIEAELGKVNVGVDLGDKASSSKSDPLADVESAESNVVTARLEYGEARGNKQARINAAVGVLKALDELGNEISAAKKKKLSSSDKRRLSDTVTSGKATLFDIKYTPGLEENATAKKLLKSVPPKLSTN